MRKSVTFTIDDGNIPTDKKLLDIVRPAGILGTFNMCGASDLTPEEYREMYRGYEIANHVRYHPKVIDPAVEYTISDEPFDTESLSSSPSVSIP